MSYRNTIALAAVLVVLVGFVYLFEMRDSGGTPTPAAEQPVPLVQLSMTDINHVEVKQGQQSVTVFRTESGGSWRLASLQAATPEMGEDADQSRVDTVVGGLASLSATRVVTEQASDLGQYGLTQPSAEITLQTTGGQKQVVRFGSANPSGSGRYAQLEGSPKVYLVYSYVVDDATRMITDPPRPVPTPTLAPPLVTPPGGATPPAALPTPTA